MSIDEKLKQNKSFTLSEEIREYISNYFTSDSAIEREVEQIILGYFNEYKITLDPHTAVGVVCGKKYQSSDDILVTLATAHPAKFKETVSRIISNNSFITDKVRDLDKLKENMIIVDNNSKDIKSIIDGKVA